MMTFTNEPSSPSDLDFDSATNYRRPAASSHSVSDVASATEIDDVDDNEDEESLEITEEDRKLLHPSNLEEQKLEFMLRELSADVQAASTLLSDIQPIAVLIEKLDATKLKQEELKKRIDGCSLTTRKPGAHQQLRLDLQQQTKIQSQISAQTTTLVEKIADWEVAYNRIFHWNGVPLRQVLSLTTPSRSSKSSVSTSTTSSSTTTTSTTTTNSAPVSMPLATPARTAPVSQPPKSALKTPEPAPKTGASNTTRQPTFSVACDTETLRPLMTPQHRGPAHSTTLAPRTGARPSAATAIAKSAISKTRTLPKTTTPRDISNRNDVDITSFLTKPSAISGGPSQENQKLSKPSSAAANATAALPSRGQGRLHYQFSVEGEKTLSRLQDS